MPVNTLQDVEYYKSLKTSHSKVTFTLNFNRNHNKKKSQLQYETIKKLTLALVVEERSKIDVREEMDRVMGKTRGHLDREEWASVVWRVW